MIEQGNIRFFIPPDLIEPSALQQVRNTASMPFVHGLAVMPDVHFGMGSTVGTVVATRGAVMPACVGVDIGCGMIAVRTSLKPEDIQPYLRAIREGIERRVPVGVGSSGSNSRVLPSAEPRVRKLWTLAEELFGDQTHMRDRMKDWELQVGSLGGGNHFIEVCVGRPMIRVQNICAAFGASTEPYSMVDERKPEEVWVILHSGSRGVGNKTGTYWTKLAKSLPTRAETCPDSNLAWLEQGSAEYDQYLKELQWCQQFALLNREEMMDRVLTELIYTVKGARNTAPGDYFLGSLKDIEVERINSHHNYMIEEEHDGQKLLITRKGAILASGDKQSLIPGSMGTNSYIVAGRGNAASFNSAPHGAGRRMSRTEARKRFTVEQVAAEMAERGIEARVREAIVDEAPGSYKDIEETMMHAKELIRPLWQLRQVVNVKGD